MNNQEPETDPIQAVLGATDTKTQNPVEHEWEFDEPPQPEGSAEPLPEGLRKLVYQIAACRWNPMEEIPKPRTVFALNGIPFATPGNISAFSALSKAGKSSVTGAIQACVLPGEGDCLGFSAENPDGLAMISVDTEQSKYHLSRKLFKSLLRKGYGPDQSMQGIPDWWTSFHLAGKEINLEWLEAIMELEYRRCGGIHSVILDGGADFLADLNDGVAASAAVKRLMALAEQYKTHILVVIHINPSAAESGKTRGHFGSELERKAETNLTIRVDKECRTVFARNARDCYIPEDKGTQFVWSDDWGMFMTATGDRVNAGEGFGSFDILEALHPDSVPRIALKDRFTETYGATARTINRHISSLLEKGLIKEAGSRKNSVLAVTPDGVRALVSSGRIESEPVQSGAKDE